MSESTEANADGSAEDSSEAEAVNDTGVGALLRASRMRIGEDLRDVADMLRIRHPYLEAIEDGRFQDLPGQAYAVGFIRAYAEHLGLDSEEVVRRYKDEVSGDGPRADLRFPTPVAEAGVPGGAVVFIGLLIAVIAYGGWYLSTTKDNFFAELIDPLPERLAGLVADKKPAAEAPAATSETPPPAPSDPAPEPASRPAPEQASEPAANEAASATEPRAAPAG
ncbi:MAG: helix-turn-helix transcriptional regulator, partial [Magnetovibrio sp.]|nr:helix-turn-helix transcriptional regulator [Magnetovibrio sp.]